MMDCLVFTLKRSIDFRRKNKIFHSQVVSTLFYFRLQVLSHSWSPDYILQPPAVLEIYYIYFGYVIRRRRKQRNRPSEEGDKQRCILSKQQPRITTAESKWTTRGGNTISTQSQLLHPGHLRLHPHLHPRHLVHTTSTYDSREARSSAEGLLFNPFNCFYFKASQCWSAVITACSFKTWRRISKWHQHVEALSAQIHFNSSFN